MHLSITASRAAQDSCRFRKIPNILSIAGTDPSGGAGAQADLKSISAAGGYGMNAVTALVAQNTRGVLAIEVPPTDFLRAQLDAVSEDVRIDAVKIGMLGSADIIRTVSAWLDNNPQPIIVLDPVMVATSGDRLLEAEAEEALRGFLKYATVITPNIPELAILAESSEPDDWDSACALAQQVAQRHQVAVIVKSGHLPGDEAGNAVVTAHGTTAVFKQKKIITPNTHGTGCSLSAALATRLALGMSLEDALGWVSAWLHGAIFASNRLAVGEGHGPINHFWRLWEQSQIADTTPAIIGDFEASDVLPQIPAAGPHTQRFWQLTGNIWASILELPFIQHLASGTLTADDFTFYQDQDALYLSSYSKALATLSSKAPSSAEQVFWARGAAECIEVESALHADWLGSEHVSAGPSHVTNAYTDFLTSTTSLNDYAVGVAAVLPCYWLYAEIGEILAQANTTNHPYSAWLSMYGSKEFRQTTQQAIEYTEQALAQAPEQTVELAGKFYQQAALHELRFFAQAQLRG